MDNLAINTSGLTRKFGNLTAVNALNLDVPQGSIYGFLGPNGAGKTTTIRLLLGLIRLHAGHIQMFGRPFPKERQSLLKLVAISTPVHPPPAITYALLLSLSQA